MTMVYTVYLFSCLTIEYTEYAAAEHTLARSSSFCSVFKCNRRREATQESLFVAGSSLMSAWCVSRALVCDVSVCQHLGSGCVAPSH